MANFSVSVVLKAVDNISRTVRGISTAVGSSFAKIEASASRASARIERMTKSLEAQRNSLRAQIVDTAAFAAPFVLAGKNAIEAEYNLRAIGNTANLSIAQVSALDRQLLSVATITNQTQAKLIEGLGTLVASGLDPIKEALPLIGVVGRAATATGANINDLAKTNFALYDNLKVPINQSAQALNILAQAGKEGRFELKNMAQYFPTLTASMQNLGVTGIPAVTQLGAALQIAQKGAGDPSEAANNFQNFLQKITAPETVKNFSKFGIDLKKELNGAIKSGKDPIYEMISLIDKATGGDQFKLGKLFGDMQVANFIKPMSANLKEYVRIRDSSASAKGVIDKDFASITTTSQERIKGLLISLEKIARITMVGPLQGLSQIVDKVNKFVSINPALVQGISNIVFWLVVGRLASLGFAYGLNFASAGVLGFAQGGAKAVKMLTGLPRQMAQFAAALKGLEVARNSSGQFVAISGATKLGAAFRVATLAVRGFGMSALGLLANPVILAAVVAIAVAALLIYKYWKPISGFFRGLWRGFIEGLKPLQPAFNGVFKALGPVIQPVIGFLKLLWNGISSLLKPVEDVGGSAEKMGQRWGRAIGGMVMSVVQAGGAMFNAGANIVNQLWQGITSLASKPVEAIKGIVQNIRDHLPHSPAKVGPLRDLHQVKIVQTIAGAIRPEPIRAAMARAVSPAMGSIPQIKLPAPAMGAVPQVRVPAPVVGNASANPAAGQSRVNVTYSPTIHLVGGGGDDFKKLLREHSDELLRLVDRANDKRQRGAYS